MKMKKELLINLVLGFIAVLIIFLIIIGYKPTQTIPTPAVQKSQSTVLLTDFGSHNSATDCWIQINGNVYDVTNYLNEHPGGADLIIPFCGGSDATEAFTTKGGRGTHSSQAENLHTQTLVGILSK